jgi:hypothetical protein
MMSSRHHPYTPPHGDRAVTAGTLQPDRIEPAGSPEGTEEVLWLIGGGILALLILGFVLTRRARQRTSEPMYEPDRPDRDDGDDHVEPLL